MNLNNATLLGNLTQDPFSKAFGEGKLFTRFSVATNYYGRDKKEHVEYHNVVAFGKVAERARDLLKKGSLVFLQGRLQTGRWVDDNKVTHSKTDIVANQLIALNKQTASVSAAPVNQSEADATEAYVSVPQAPFAVPQAA